MIYIESQNFSLNRILLLVIGLWPYQQSMLTHFQLIIFYSILMTFVVFQLTTFITTEISLDIFIKVTSFALLYFIFLIKYNSFWINIQAVKNLLEQIEHIYNELRDKNEIAIIEKYGNNAKLYTIGLTFFATCSLFMVSCMSIWQHIFHVFQPINESRPHVSLCIITEYFIDQEKYFYLNLLHMNAATLIGGIAMLATGVMLLVYYKHACGMFRIASYRLQQAMPFNILQNVRLQNDLIIYKKIICAVDIHRKALKYSESLVTSFEGSFFCLAITIVICMSLNLFRVFQIASFGGDVSEFCICVIFIIVLLLYLFLTNHAGQDITDHNNHVFLTAYNVQWYVAPLHVQRLILFLLQRGSKTFHLNIYGIYIASLQCFFSLTSTSISYFTVMYSIQKPVTE